MAHPYTTDARVRLFLGTVRVETLGDRDNSGTIDTGLMADAIERACNRIDGALGVRYSMPCAAITDTPATPGQVADLADIGVAMFLYQWLEPKSDDYIEFRDAFQGDDGKGGQLGRYRDGDEVVIGLAELGADVGDESAAHESIGTITAGGTDIQGNRTSAWVVDSTTDQTRGI